MYVCMNVNSGKKTGPTETQTVQKKEKKLNGKNTNFQY